MKIAIDLDGVIMNSVEAYLEYWHPRYSIYDFKTHYMLDVLGIGVDQFLKEWHSVPLEKIELIGGERVLKLLQRFSLFSYRNRYGKHQIYFLTSNNGWGCLRICHWLRKRGIWLPIQVSDSKQDWVDRFDILIDDNGELSEWVGKDQLILIDQPWNRWVESKYDRFADVADVFDYYLWDRMAEGKEIFKLAQLDGSDRNGIY